ncbi:unnamed protein product [Heligmosomoides polygyrus]|uniref:MFS domain-containing protein n=1 Tax=Heligmosomoides polygyrus TaxID=6339 RepID=A0A183F506_HELPZ|nr:unnamed protein product [Heligmosomoides polygyrus]
MVASTSLGSIVGAYILGSAIAAAMSKYFAAFLAYIAFPVAINYAIKQRERNLDKDVNIRRMMVAMSFAQGILAGCTINQRYLQSQPLAFVTPIAFSFGYAAVVQRANGDRFMILGSAMAAALAANLFLGGITGTLSSSYEFLALGYVVICGAIMQVVIHDAHWVHTISLVQSKPLRVVVNVLLEQPTVLHGLEIMRERQFQSFIGKPEDRKLV